MSADAGQLALAESRFDRIAGLVEVIRSIDDHVVLSAVPGLIAAVQQARDTCRVTNYGDPEQLRKAIDAVLMVLQAGALCTVTHRDDDTVELIRRLRTSIDFLIPIVAGWLAGNKSFGATDEDGRIAGIDPATIMLIVQLVIKLLEFWKSRT